MVDLKKQVAFEKHEAQRCNCDYEDLKRHLDRVEDLSGHRYTPTSPRSDSWIVWSAAWDARQAEINELKAKLEAAQVPEGFVLVPKECPDPIFADKLFDLLCKKAHGEFGDDQMIFFSDINESEIWEKMIEAAQGEGHE